MRRWFSYLSLLSDIKKNESNVAEMSQCDQRPVLTEHCVIVDLRSPNGPLAPG